MLSNKTPTPFDLNAAVQSWREELKRSPSFHTEDLDELESHVRDSQAALIKHGLTDEEAFLIAIRRAGSTEVIAAEFATINRSAIWQERLLWMAAATIFSPLFSLPAIFLGPVPSAIRPMPVILIAGMVWLQADLVRKPLRTPLRLTSILLLVALVSAWLRISLDDFWLAGAFQLGVSVIGLSFFAWLRRRRIISWAQSSL